MSLRLTYHAETSVPVEIEGLTPDWAFDKSLAEIERLAAQALISQLAHAAPLDRPTLLNAALVYGLHVNEGMWIPEYELHNLTFEVHLFADVVRGGVRVVSISCAARHQRCSDTQKKDSAHYFFSLRLR